MERMDKKIPNDNLGQINSEVSKRLQMAHSKRFLALDMSSKSMEAENWQFKGGC